MVGLQSAKVVITSNLFRNLPEELRPRGHDCHDVIYICFFFSIAALFFHYIFFSCTVPSNAEFNTVKYVLLYSLFTVISCKVNSEVLMYVPTLVAAH